MTKYREILRLHALEFSERNIALSCSVSRNTVSKSLKDAESVRHFIYTLRDYSSEEWIVEVDSKNADSGLVYRERSVENMPEGLKSIGIIEYNEEP